jgi:heptaprenyl diphosphate synthase
MNKFRISELAKKYTEHDMIQQHTELPEFPDSRVRLLHTYLNKGSKTPEQTELYSLVTLLVQLGMDTHDLIEVGDQGHENTIDRSRQLKVLAGDYFSSGFYHLLSQAGQIEMITLLSGAICEINRMKMNLYTKMKQLKITAEDYLQQSVGIKMQLFLTFTKVMDGVAAKGWPELLQAFTRCEVIIQELHRNESPERFMKSWAYWDIFHKATKEEKKHLKDGQLDRAKWRTFLIKYNVRSSLLEMLQQQIQLLVSAGQQLDSDKLRKELAIISEPFMRYLSTPVLEEI